MLNVGDVRDGKITISYRYQLKKHLFSAEEYHYLKEFFNEIIKDESDIIFNDNDINDEFNENEKIPGRVNLNSYKNNYNNSIDNDNDNDNTDNNLLKKNKAADFSYNNIQELIIEKELEKQNSTNLNLIEQDMKTSLKSKKNKTSSSDDSSQKRQPLSVSASRTVSKQNISYIVKFD